MSVLSASCRATGRQQCHARTSASWITRRGWRGSAPTSSPIGHSSSPHSPPTRSCRRRRAGSTGASTAVSPAVYASRQLINRPSPPISTISTILSAHDYYRKEWSYPCGSCMQSRNRRDADRPRLERGGRRAELSSIQSEMVDEPPKRRCESARTAAELLAANSLGSTRGQDELCVGRSSMSRRH